MTVQFSLVVSFQDLSATKLLKLDGNRRQAPNIARESITNRSAPEAESATDQFSENIFGDHQKIFLEIIKRYLQLKMLSLILLTAGGCSAQPVESNLIIPSSSPLSISSSSSSLAMAGNCSQTRQEIHILANAHFRVLSCMFVGQCG